jgi:hypothetical protein
MDLGTFSAALRQAIDSQPVNAPENPLNLAVSGLDLSEPEQLYILFGALTRYVNLDLSGCKGITMAAAASNQTANRVKIVTLTLPASVTMIEPDWDPQYERVSGKFSGCSTLTAADMPGVRYIGDHAFSFCESLVTVNAPQVVSIGSYAFQGCLALAELDFPELVSVGEMAFQRCYGLEALSFPSLVLIERGGFGSCGQLTRISAPKLATIADMAFAECYILSEFTLGPTPPVLGGRILALEQGSVITFRVPAASIQAYWEWDAANAEALSGNQVTRKFLPSGQ